MNASSNSKRVAIIGCGPSGISACKSMIENGLEPTVFEQSNKLGGIWQKNSDRLWPGLHTNVTKYNMGFSDFKWNDNDLLYPSADQVADYLIRYVKHFNIESHIKCNRLVKYVNQMADSKWLVRWVCTISGKEHQDLFDFIVLSSGVFAKPYIPETFKNMDSFKGKLLHSRNYHDLKSREASSLNGKRVIVIGNAPSAAEISSDLAEQGAVVTNIFRRAYWIFNRLVRYDPINQNKRLPYEFLLWSRKLIEQSKQFKSVEENNVWRNTLTSNLCREQNECNDENLYMDPNTSNGFFLTLSDEYMKYVRNKRITPKKTTIKCFYENGIKLEDDSEIEGDIIVICTGYYAGLEYIDSKILEKIEYDKNNIMQPIILYKATFHPDVKNFACLGLVHYPFWTICELQGIWASLVFSGKVNLPSKEIMLKYMDKQREFRIKPLQIPHVDIEALADEIANEIGFLPDLNNLKESNPELFKCLYEGGLLSVHYRLNDEKTKDTALETIYKVNDIIKNTFGDFSING